MMAINFPAAAFLASLKGPSQIMYCISQDTGAPVVVYKDSQNVQQSVNVQPWQPAHDVYQQKEGQNSAIINNQQQSTIRAGNQVATIQIPVPSQSNVSYSTQPNSYYPTSPPNVQMAPGYIQVPGQIYAITQSQHVDEKNKIETNQQSQAQTPNPDYNQTSVSSELEDGKNFNCSLCKKAFRLKSTLIQHERIHLDSRPFACTYDNNCRKTFRQKSHLIQHSRIHFDSKPFPCSFQGCGKSFRQKAILSQHERIHCDASSHLLYKNVGENGTLWPHDLPYPNEIQTKDEELANNNQPKEQQYPPYSHSVFGSLADGEYQKPESKSEMSTQQTSMPLYVRCPICQISYKQKSTLLQHGCVHIESRPYPCLFLKCGEYPNPP